MTDTANVYAGNAFKDGDAYRGWLLGSFVEPATDVRHTSGVEVKWWSHPAGDDRPEWVTGETRTTVLMLIEGSWILTLRRGGVETEHRLTQHGDYVVWGPGVDHHWHAVEDSVMLTVRWVESQ